MLICIWIKNSVIVPFALAYDFRKITNVFVSVERPQSVLAYYIIMAYLYYIEKFRLNIDSFKKKEV